MKLRKEIIKMLGIERQIKIERNGDVFTFFQNSWFGKDGYIFVDICVRLNQEGQQIFPNGKVTTTAFHILTDGQKGYKLPMSSGIKLPLTSSQEMFFEVCSNWLDQYFGELKREIEIKEEIEKKQLEEIRMKEIEEQPNMVLF